MTHLSIEASTIWQTFNKFRFLNQIRPQGKSPKVSEELFGIYTY